MFLLTAFFEGGPAMYPTLLAGIALLVAAARFARRREAGRLRQVQELRALTLCLGALGAVVGLMHTVVALFGNPPPQSLALAKGLSEIINNLGLGLLLGITSALVTTIAAARAPAEAADVS